METRKLSHLTGVPIPNSNPLWRGIFLSKTINRKGRKYAGSL